MAYEKLRQVLDAMPEARLMRLHEEVLDSPDGSIHEMEGVQIPKEQLLQLINQALVVDESS